MNTGRIIILHSGGPGGSIVPSIREFAAGWVIRDGRVWLRLDAEIADLAERLTPGVQARIDGLLRCSPFLRALRCFGRWGHIVHGEFSFHSRPAMHLACQRIQGT